MDEQREKEWALKPFIRTLAVILVVGEVALGAMAFSAQAISGESPILAQDDTTPEPPYFGKGGFWGFPGPGRHGGFGLGTGTEYDGFLADALGISVEDLQNAYSAANEAALDQAVADGRISEEQAALIRARWALAATIDPEAIMADALGISVEDLQAARDEGTTLSELMDELGLDPQDVRDAAQAGYEDAIQSAVDTGVITQDQADQILDEGVGGMGLFGPHMGPRHGGGFFPGEPEMRRNGSDQDTNL